jgi:hypothetical protein
MNLRILGIEILREIDLLGIRYIHAQGIICPGSFAGTQIAAPAERENPVVRSLFVVGVMDWKLDASAMAEIDRIVSESVTDPIGPEYLASKVCTN